MFPGANSNCCQPSHLMIPNHSQFLQAVQDRKKVWIKFHSTADNGFLEKACAPMAYGPGSGVQDGLNRYWLWDYAQTRGSYALKLLPQQIVELQVLGEGFDPGQFVVEASPLSDCPIAVPVDLPMGVPRVKP